eukprot:4838359-Pleurochrysis_carterae.AAC.1
MPAGTFILNKLSMPFEVIPDAPKRTEALLIVAHSTKHALTDLSMSATRPRPSCSLAAISEEDTAETARAHTHLKSFMIIHIPWDTSRLTHNINICKGSYLTLREATLRTPGIRGNVTRAH